MARRIVCGLIGVVLALGAAAPEACCGGRAGKKRTHLHPERYYQERWCARHKGRMEVRLKDGTRCDCVTKDRAVEVEFAPKWTEAVGQALYYAMRMEKRAGIVLILERELDWKYWLWLQSVIERYRLPIEAEIYLGTVP